MNLRLDKKITILFVIVLLATQSAFALAEKDTGNLGEIRQSLLDTQNFQRIYGDGWVLMDGRDISNSDLVRERLWPSSTLPDARGVYLRGRNYDRDPENGSPLGDCSLGTYYHDTFKSHTHIDAGHDHTHNLHIPTTHGEGGSAPGRGAGAGWQSEQVAGKVATSNANIQPTGKKETRPRSIIVNTYIKINRTIESAERQRIMTALDSIPTEILNSERLRQILRGLLQKERSASASGRTK